MVGPSRHLNDLRYPSAPVKGTPGVVRVVTELLINGYTPEQLRKRLALIEDPEEADDFIAWMAVGDGSWQDSPAAMAHYLTQGRYRRWRYVEHLSNKFVDAVEGRSTRQIWNLPGRYGKSLGAQWGCVWCLEQTHGAARIIYTGYGYNLAVENAIGIRDKLLGYPDLLKVRMRRDRRRADRFVTDAGGGILAAGIDGTIVGFGAGDGGGLIVDDPFKNWQQAHSAARRDYVANQFKGTLRNRLDSEDAWIIVIHHRVHEDDLTARLVADTAAETGDDWEVVALPALAVAGDPLGRELGEALEPARFTREQCIARARGMGTYLASGLEQQNPTPEEGNELLRAWFVLAETAELPRRPDQCIASWDLKLKDREAGDYVVGGCWWKVSGAFWLMDMLRGQYDHATTANAIALLQVRNPQIKRHVIEAAGSADEVVPVLRAPQPDYEVDDVMAARLGMTAEEREAVAKLRRRGMGNLKPEPVKGDKRVRARAYIAPAAEPGNVRMPADAPWVAAYLDEHAAFPNGSHDDQVDMTSQALRALRGSGQMTLVQRPRGAVGP